MFCRLALALLLVACADARRPLALTEVRVGYVQSFVVRFAHGCCRLHIPAT
jgi:hypothetical protein